MTDTVAARIAAVYQELADLEARDAAAAQLPPRRVRRQTGASVVYSVPSGLSARRGQKVTGAVDRVEAARHELRAVLR